ncbi:MAG: hypothetical protein LUE27_09570 [Clostridia bacterium]|nr:hypothetical protein [Clostridia bacterium]
MGKYFPKLTQTRVFIQTDEHGGGFNCPMLPVSALARMGECSERLAKVSTVQEMAAVRDDLIALAETVLPEEHRAGLRRLDIPKLTELIAYLMYGDSGNDDQPREEPEKN